jgi:hypothetical protein
MRRLPRLAGSALLRPRRQSPPPYAFAMPRTRVHNMSVSLDGYAAGQDVTFDAPIGGAERLFGQLLHLGASPLRLGT